MTAPPSIVWLTETDREDSFPPVQHALKEPDGLVAAGGDLSPKRLQAAYRRGIFPWYSRGQPILWWSPDPRAVLIPSELKVTRSLAKRLRNGGFDVRFDTAFASVIEACGDTNYRPDGTWIVREMRAAYCKLHELGMAHSVEVWRDSQLVGGLYGVALGRIFYGESMFSRTNDASKVALKFLCDELIRRDFVLVDCQMATPHLLSMGAKLIPRTEFVAAIEKYAQPPDPLGPWRGPPS
jgi:leucyl/phenylalanyl-tRNA---protein transferase